MSQPPHSNVNRLLALDPIIIRGLDRNSTSRHLGRSDGMTPD